jgi:ABC-type phosphate transport system substrate-binding protein
MKKNLYIVILLLVSAVLVAIPAASETIIIAGAGPSTKIVEKFFSELSSQGLAEGYTFEVPPKSVKHAGGIKATETNLFGRTGRPLNEKEKAMNKGEIFLARVPISFVVGSNVGVTGLTIEQLEDLYTMKITNWKELGGADKIIFLIGREPTEALYSVLKKGYPFFKGIEFDHIVKKDHLMVEFMGRTSAGKRALGFGAKPNLEGLNIVEVKNFSSGVSLGLVYDLMNEDAKLVETAKKFAKSDAWIKSLEQNDLLPPE